ncbi:MAG: hypothetical protein ACM3S4_11725 [Burkholderiales bacterium]
MEGCKNSAAINYAPEQESGGSDHVKNQIIVDAIPAVDNKYTGRDTMRKSRKQYEQLFASYPDVVTLPEFRKMLGGISRSTAYKLMHENRVKHFYIQTTFLIPKEWVIDYVMSDHYNEYKKLLKAQI